MSFFTSLFSSTSISFCFVLFCFVLFCFVLFCFVLFCFVLFCFVLFCFVLFCFVLFCFVLFCFVLFCFTDSLADYYDPYYVYKRPKRLDIAGIMHCRPSLLPCVPLSSSYLHFDTGAPVLDASLSGDFQSNNCMYPVLDISWLLSLHLFCVFISLLYWLYFFNFFFFYQGWCTH